MEKKFALCATKKINILTLVLSEKKILNETKNHNPPPPAFKLNGRSLKLVNPKNNEKFIAEFVVIKDGTLTPLLGNKAVQAMSLLTINYENIKAVKQGAPSEPLSKEKVLKEFADVFEGTGKLQGKYYLELDEKATPIVHPLRKVPVAIKERLRNELERLTKMDIIKPVSTPTQWVSSLVTVVKPGKLRICIDPKHLNQNIKRSHYPLPTIEDLIT